MSKPMDLDLEQQQLYNRQLYALGAEAMKKMASANFLLVGLSGLGCEIAKNLILSGVGSIALYDNSNVSYDDLSSLFYATEEDVGKNRVTAVFEKLNELNRYVVVKHVQGDLSIDLCKQYHVVIFADQTTSLHTKLFGDLHASGVKIVSAESRGLSGLIFCDFGEGFIVNDTDGEEVSTCLITSVTQSNPATITVHEDLKHNLQDGDLVYLFDIQGPDELNEKEYEVKATNPTAFTINVDTTQLPPYIRGGYMKSIKKPATINFETLEQALNHSEFIFSDYSKMEAPAQLHLYFQSLHRFIQKHGRSPLPYNEEEAHEVVSVAQELGSAKGITIQTDYIKKLTFVSSGNLSPLASFLGGFAAQEALKACSGKFTPINQWFYFDSIDSLPEELPTAVDAQPKGTRYDGQIRVFGSENQSVIGSQRNFVVGAGALGCEYLKLFAMMGVGCGAGGKVIVTDMDTIERSNLSRQFLFRDRHIGQLKSETAANAARAMNHSLNITAMADKVAPETDHIFHDEFWESLNGVTNALDNVAARLFVDTKCVTYRKPLMESGTLGTKGNTQVVAPFITESYGSSRDPPEKSIPICTLKNFPNAIEHTIQWARDNFEGMFTQTANDVNNYLTRSDFMTNLDKESSSKMSTVKTLYEALVDHRCRTFPDCVKWARSKFEENYNNQIQQLLYNFPEDARTNSGEPFWSGPKRPPRPIEFSQNDETHVTFVATAALLRAKMYGIKDTPTNFNDIAVLASQVHLPTFVPKKANIQTEENKDNKPQESSDDFSLEELISKLPSPQSLSGTVLEVIEFEKDDDTNHHIDFITSCSNLRARNYKIPEADRNRTKQIAGKIIPAMVTTTALICGLVTLEWYKLMLTKNPKIESFRNAFVNIALPFVTLSEPVPPKSSQYGDKKFTLWDRFDVNTGTDLTLQEFLNYFQQNHKLDISMISCGQAIIYSFFTNKQKLKERLGRPVSDVVKEITKQEFAPTQKYLSMEICCTLGDDDVDVPYVRYRFRF